jgi:hypothetical protein
VVQEYFETRSIKRMLDYPRVLVDQKEISKENKEMMSGEHTLEDKKSLKSWPGGQSRQNQITRQPRD